MAIAAPNMHNAMKRKRAISSPQLMGARRKIAVDDREEDQDRHDGQDRPGREGREEPQPAV